MPVHPQIQALLDKGAGVPATHTLPVAEAREQYESRIALMARPESVAAVSDRLIQGPGGPLRLRVYTPCGTGPFGMTIFFHGSGFVLCSVETHDGMCRNITAGAGCVVVSVDYRLAPEHPFPAGLDDCVFATRWSVMHAAELGADPARIAVAGDSAGGNMAAATALILRDEGGPQLSGQLLIYPVTDHYSTGTRSYVENGDGYGLTRDTMVWFWDHYLRHPADAANPYASPSRARGLSRLPAAFIATAEFDPLRDEAEQYATRLAESGVAVEMMRYMGMNHGFLFWVGIVDVAELAMGDSCRWLRAILS